MYKCEPPGCDYATIERRELARHNKRTHTGEQAYTCDHPSCDYAARDSCDLQRRKRTHTGEH